MLSHYLDKSRMIVYNTSIHGSDNSDIPDKSDDSQDSGYADDDEANDMDKTGAALGRQFALERTQS